MDEEIAAAQGIAPAPAIPAPDVNQVGSDAFIQRVKDTMAATEAPRSNGEVDYSKANSLGFMGKYQFGRARLADLGFHGSSRDFLDNPQLQEDMMTKHVQDYIGRMKSDGIIDDTTPAAAVAGKLAFAHISGYGGLKKQSGAVDANGVGGSMYEKVHSQGFLDPSQSQALLKQELQNKRQGSGMYQGASDEALRAPGLKQTFTKSQDMDAAYAAATGQVRQGYDDANKAHQDQVAAEIEKVTGQPFTVDISADPSVAAEKFISDSSLFGFRPGTAILDVFGGKSWSEDQAYGRAFDAKIAALKEANPGIKLPVQSYSEVRLRAVKDLQAVEDRAALNNPDNNFMAGVANFGYSMAGYMSDPREWVKMLLPVAKGAALAQVGIRGLQYAASEVPSQITLQGQKVAAGDERAGLAQGAANVAMVGAGGAALELASKGIGKLVSGIGKASEAGLPGLKEWARKAETEVGSIAETKMGQEIQSTIADIENAGALHDVSGTFHPNGEKMSVEQLAQLADRAETQVVQGKVNEIMPEGTVPHYEPNNIDARMLRDDMADLGKTMDTWDKFKETSALTSKERGGIDVPASAREKMPFELAVERMTKAAELMKRDVLAQTDAVRIKTEEAITKMQEAIPVAPGKSIKDTDIHIEWTDENGLPSQLNLRQHQKEMQKEVGTLKQLRDCIINNGG